MRVRCCKPGTLLSMSFRNAFDPALCWSSVGRKKSRHCPVTSSLGGGRSAWMWSGKRFVPSPGCRWSVWQDRCMSSKGLPIGGVLSGLCLSVVLGKQEYEWNANRACIKSRLGFDFGSFRVSQCVAVLRYVDDILLISLRYCPAMLGGVRKKVIFNPDLCCFRCYM